MSDSFLAPVEAAEPTFTTYAILFNKVMDTADRTSALSINEVSVDDFNMLAYISDKQNNQVSTINLDGTSYNATFIADSLTAPFATPSVRVQWSTRQSRRQKYYIIDDAAGILYIFTAAKLLTSIDLSSFFSTVGTFNAISEVSATGKFIVVAGQDTTNTKRLRVAIIQGS